MPKSYQGREQAYVKHRLLEVYLEKLFLIIGTSARQLGIKELAYVDCFAGPWGDESESLDSTSIAVSLRVLANRKAALKRLGMDVAFRALYIEKDPKSFRRLQQFLAARSPDDILAEPLQGDFVALIPAITEWARDAFTFFFIDPTSWRPVSVTTLQPLLERAQSEFLINFMYDFANRAVSMADFRVQIKQLLGETPDVADIDSAEREKKLLGIYRRNLKRLVPARPKWPARSVYARVLDPVKNRPKYHLVYLTTHPRGVVEFMEALETFDLIQKRVRAATRQQRREQKSGISDLFDDADNVAELEGHATLEQVEQFWLERLSSEPKRISFKEFADMLEATDWFPGDLQRALGSLIAKGVVRNVDAIKARRKRFVHLDDEGERLQLIEKAR